MEKELTLYQLIDGDGEQVGLIETDAPPAPVQKLWRKILRDELLDLQLYHIEDVGMSDEADAEKLVELLSDEGYKVERKWCTEISAYG